MSFYLSFKEIWRNKGRYLLFSLVIALITTLVLFIAALAGGLSRANRQFLDNLEADLLVYQADADKLISASRLNNKTLAAIRRIEGVEDVGPLGFSSATIVNPVQTVPVDVTLIGVEPGKPGNPQILSGSPLNRRYANDVIIDKKLAGTIGVKPGGQITIKTIQGTDEEYFNLTVVGLSDENQFLFQPSIFVPIETWDQVKPQASNSPRTSQLIYNLIAVSLLNPADAPQMTQNLQNQIANIQVLDKETAIQSIPGYSVQQSTLNTQQAFTLLIGALVLGGFFQIQTMQKIGLIGMLKAIGTSNRSVAGANIVQIITVTVFGVLLGLIGTLLISLGMPPEVPIIFNARTIATSLAALLLIGPLGSLVAIRIALKVEPLQAIGL
ncbi:ABC transporter permease [Chloroflexota bacterium]